MVFASDFPSAFKEATAYGWELPKANRIDWDFFSKKLNAEVSRLEGIYRNLLKNSGVQTFDQHAKVVDAHTIELASGKQITSEYILLATGGKPDLPDIPGIDNVITSDQVFSLSALPEKLLVVGGGILHVNFLRYSTALVLA